jgi:hypothetical protein
MEEKLLHEISASSCLLLNGPGNWNESGKKPHYASLW